MQAAELATRARTVAQLGELVQAMRTLAGARRRRAQERFSGLERYAAATRALLADALALLGEREQAFPAALPGVRRVIVLFSEHGFVGALNDRLLDHALASSTGQPAELVAVGARGQRLCRERGIGALVAGPMPTSDSGVPVTSERLIEDSFTALVEGRVGEVRVVFAEHAPPLGWRPRELRLFPPEVATPAQGSAGNGDLASAARSASASSPRESTGDAPLHTLGARELVERAVEEYAFAQVSWAVGEAFASEQAARFVAMDSARRHIDEKLRELDALGRRLRQEAITSEIIEIAAGAESSGGPS